MLASHELKPKCIKYDFDWAHLKYIFSLKMFAVAVCKTLAFTFT